MTKTIILKVGGSLLSPSKETPFDFKFAYSLRDKLIELSDQGYSFVIAIGGGFTSREYQRLLTANGETESEDLHRVGIAITNVHIEILKNLFPKELVFPQPQNTAQLHDFKLQGSFSIAPYKFMFINSDTPGRSNDWNAAEAAQIVGVGQVISMKNIDAVYSADPRQDSQAKALDRLNWEQYFEIVGGRGSHQPGASYPIDLTTAGFAENEQISFIIIGPSIDNLHNLITLDNPYQGTVVAINNNL